MSDSVSDHADERWSTPTTPLLAYGSFTRLGPPVTRVDEAGTELSRRRSRVLVPSLPSFFQAVSGTSKARTGSRAFVLVGEKPRPAPVAAAIARSFIRFFEGDAEGAVATPRSRGSRRSRGSLWVTRLPDLPDAASHEARASTPDWRRQPFRYRHHDSGIPSFSEGNRAPDRGQHPGGERRGASARCP